MGRMDLTVLSAFRNELAASKACPWHAHDGIELVHHVEGTGWTETADGRRWEIHPGDVTLYPARLRHIQYMRTPGVDECVVMRCRGAEWTVPLRAVLHRNDRADPEIPRLFRVLTESAPGTGPLERFERDCRAGLLLGRFLRRAGDRRPSGGGGDPGWAEAACRLMAESPATLRRPQDVARAVGLSAGHLRHVFKTRMGLSLQQWLIAARLDRAEELLRHSPLTIKAIAYECGFRTPRYFSTAFKKRHGCQPQAFREDPSACRSGRRTDWPGRQATGHRTPSVPR